VKLNTFISIHKGATGLVVLGLIAIFQEWDNPTAWVYLALHGGYGILWGLKSYFFPDRSWESKVNWFYGAFVAWGSLTTYWAAPFLLIWRGVRAPLWFISGCILIYIIGVFFHFAADMQKTMGLNYRPGQLITDGIWALCRNPNYFGELLIYLAFALLAMHWLPIAIISLWVIFYWIPNMRRKDRSLARYAEFEAYRARTKLFIPYIF
jgi:protein-S-isoprenylcysteine O-methyltransferase Ste14